MDTNYDDNSNLDTSFNVDDDYKPIPLVISGPYYGTIKEVKLNQQNGGLRFTIVLNGNEEATCSDGETAVDGIEVDSSLWLPKANDKNELTSKGNMSKFQSKINMMKSFSERTGLNVASFEAIINAIDECEWLGYPVIAQVTVDTYQGRQFNRCNDFAKNENTD